jgi:hypothetical protein
MTTLAYHHSNRVALSIQATEVAYKAQADDRPGLMLDVLGTTRGIGLLPHQVLTRVGEGLADLCFTTDADERTLMAAIAQLESQLGCMFEKIPPSQVLPPSDLTTSALRFEADHGGYPLGCYLLIARGGDWAGDVSDAMSDTLSGLASFGSAYEQATQAGQIGSLERLLTALRAPDGNLLYLDADRDWDGSGQPGVDLVFHVPAKAAFELKSKVLRNALKSVVELTGGRLVCLSDLDLSE